MEGEVKNSQNHRQIDARGEAEGIKTVIYGILKRLSNRLVDESIEIWHTFGTNYILGQSSTCAKFV